ncbi:D-alanyl-D-alanine carboxypeptidase/D-alanyl-D-alanine endopeptidase [Sandaracinobacteroides saxicola]|uniref:D-alanyl-D-alanine carboxypeptidase/D-alanyl-D-alanine endopeptidase n=1 Tax=Sandaracinobacteroides saxicola TaxID=2759707 RepID=UPI001FB129BD|nr:D-alanyl-D-alanine carboxypeptidase/D-alanyl-D-alanine-endopeptidase [Sandaracinobacteroides saxicola]
MTAPSASADEALAARVGAVLAEAGVGVRFGMLVVDDDGREVVAIAPDMRFIPASNTKLLTTAATFDHAAGLAGTGERALEGRATGGAAVRLEGGDVILEGRGEARLSSAPDCVATCLSTLADAVAAKTRRVRDVVGDDSRFPDERWPAGMSWNNLPERSGTGISALTLDNNEQLLRVVPGAVGRAPVIETGTYLAIDNRAVTVAAPGAGRRPGAMDVGRLAGERVVRLDGAISAGAPETIGLGIDDPAHYAAWRLAAMLRERGVVVTGDVRVRHRAPRPFDDPRVRAGAPAMRPPRPAVLAELPASELEATATVVNKVSQNLYAELLLRRLGAIDGTGSVADGLAKVAETMARAGVARTAWDLSDGSGMSTYNRLSPRATVTLLRWVATQPWAAAYRATLPVAGMDGTLRRRFRGTPLQGVLVAKTGAVNATNALAGTMVAASGRTLTFAIYANDVPGGGGVTGVMDRALGVVAAGS